MEHLLAADILLFGQGQSTPNSTGNYSTLLANVFYFATRLTDCLWSGKNGVETCEQKHKFSSIRGRREENLRFSSQTDDADEEARWRNG